MKCFIVWPEREQLIVTMPMSLRKYCKAKAAVIIDCFESFVNKSYNLRTRSAICSQYKHRNTVKLLIGVTPKGVILLISNG